MTADRDPTLGGALRDLPVPEHGPEFWAALEQRLEAEANVRELSAARHRRRPPSLPGLLFLGAAAVVAVVLALTLSRAGEGESSGQVATKPEPGGGEGDVVMVSGTAVVVQHPVPMPYCPGCGDGSPVERRFGFSRASDGSFSETSDTGAKYAFDAEAGRSVELVKEAEGGAPSAAHVRNGLAPDHPDPSAWPLMTGDFDDLAVFVMAKARSGDEDLVDVTVGDRRAWRYRTKLTPNQLSEASPDEAEVTVDVKTGVPLAGVQYRQGRTISELRVEDLRTSTTVDRAAFAVEIPPGTPTTTEDLGYRRSSLDRLRQEIGYSLGEPQVPSGFELAGVWVRPGRGGPTGAEGSNPPSTDVAMLVYRDGFRQLAVTTRRHVRTGPWSNPFLGEGQLVTPEQFTAQPAGESNPTATTGELVFEPTTIPHAWSIAARDGASGFVITASGPVAKAELTMALSSVRPT